jgi:hypothetical protein
MAISLRAKDIVECRIYGRNKHIERAINLLVPRCWRERAWHHFAVLRAKSAWIERHTRGNLEHIWIERRSD